MVGIGETDEEIIEVMDELREAGCQILTIGQYLAPTQRKRHLPVERFLSPEEFENYRQKGLEMGFVYVESGPLVRSSYIAEQGYQAAMSMPWGSKISDVTKIEKYFFCNASLFFKLCFIGMAFYDH